MMITQVARSPGALIQNMGYKRAQASEWEDCNGMSVEDGRDGLGLSVQVPAGEEACTCRGYLGGRQDEAGGEVSVHGRVQLYPAS